MDYRQIFERDFDFQIKWNGNGEGIGRCPNPLHEDKKPSCSFNSEKGVWYCHSCGDGNNAYSYAKEHSLDNPHQSLIIVILTNISRLPLLKAKISTHLSLI